MKHANSRIIGVTGRNRDAHIIDAMGGGLCKVHGKYFGHGKYGLRDCPFCDIEENHKKQSSAQCPAQKGKASQGSEGST